MADMMNIKPWEKALLDAEEAKRKEGMKKKIERMIEPAKKKIKFERKRKKGGK